CRERSGPGAWARRSSAASARRRSPPSPASTPLSGCSRMPTAPPSSTKPEARTRSLRRPLVSIPIVVLAHGPGERLERGSHRRPADRVENALQDKAAILAGAHGKVPVLDQVCLLDRDLLRSHRVPVV